MRFWVSAVVVGLLFFLAPSAAFGHASLTSSTPSDGATLDTTPERVVLTFSEELFADLIEVSVLDGAGDLVMATEAEQTPPPGTDVIVPWPGDLPPGDYAVAFRVVSADGHPVTGQVNFSYSQAASPEAASPEPASPEPASPEPEPVEETAAQEVTAQEEVTAEQAGAPDSSLIGPLLIGAAVVVGVGVVVSLVLLARSRQ